MTAPGGMQEQMGRFMRRLDDPWGIVWRVQNKIRGIDVRRTYRQQRARLLTLHQDRPVFVIGVPRSATTALYRVLSAHPELRSVGHEGHDCWRRFHHPRLGEWNSDWVGRGMVSGRERSFVRRWWYARVGDGRFLDKTPCNAMRIPYLLDLYPDAHIVWMKRDPRAVLNSLLAGWGHPRGRFRTYFVPEELAIPGYRSTHQWCFGLIEGWRELRTSPIAAIVAEQYRQYSNGALRGRKEVPPDQWHEIAMEDLLRAPETTMTVLLSRLGLPRDDAVMERARALGERAENTMSASGPADWRHHEEAVIELVGELRDVIAASGYDVDALLAGSEPAPYASVTET